MSIHSMVALPSFGFHGQEDLRKGINTEGRVLKPALPELLLWMRLCPIPLNVGLIRAQKGIPQARQKGERTRF